MRPDLVRDIISQVLPSYQIVDLLGSGSFGAVYRIRDDLKERAVKVVPLAASPHVENGKLVSAGEKVERDFRHIVESYEKIACDEIVNVYDFHKVVSGGGGRQETAFAVIVMELYPANLMEYLVGYFEKHRRPLEVHKAQILLEKTAHMLGTLYTRRGFLFEDLKPENILVRERDGDFKVVVGDIGGLKSLGSVSVTGSQVTLSYSAPEVVSRGSRPDLASMVYSFGLLAFFILEGRVPHDGLPVAERCDRLRKGGVPFTRRDVPPELRAVVERCLSYDPARRYPDFSRIVMALSGREVSPGNDFAGDTISLGGGGREAAFGGETMELGGRPGPQPVPGGGAGQPVHPLYRTFQNVNRTVGLRGSVSPGTASERARAKTRRISSERDDIGGIDNEIRDLVIRAGDVHKLSRESYRVYGDVLVERGAVLTVEHAKLYFDEGSGIVVRGILRAADSSFSAIDLKKRWSNVLFEPGDPGMSFIRNCAFRFGRGRTPAAMAGGAAPAGFESGSRYTFGGGLLLLGGSGDRVSLRDCTFYYCMAQVGGGLCASRSDVAVENCHFEHCTAVVSGGGMALLESIQQVRNCRLTNCSAGKEGGGIFCQGARPVIENCTLTDCRTDYLHGGGISISGSNPVISKCKLERCVASREAGGIYCDGKSRPKLHYPAFFGCKPTDTNCKV